MFVSEKGGLYAELCRSGDHVLEYEQKAARVSGTSDKAGCSILDFGFRIADFCVVRVVSCLFVVPVFTVNRK